MSSFEVLLEVRKEAVVQGDQVIRPGVSEHLSEDLPISGP
jgi:hypothetical protein